MQMMSNLLWISIDKPNWKFNKLKNVTFVDMFQINLVNFNYIFNTTQSCTNAYCKTKNHSLFQLWSYRPIKCGPLIQVAIFTFVNQLLHTLEVGVLTMKVGKQENFTIFFNYEHNNHDHGCVPNKLKQWSNDTETWNAWPYVM